MISSNVAMWFLGSCYLVKLPLKEHLSCRQPLSARSEHKLNTGHQCSMRDVKTLCYMM